ncbi:MAG: ATP-binding protein [SAR324 cluster bacterium]|nr:ATP-binding protein [SAR324 cluster bacterium]
MSEQFPFTTIVGMERAKRSILCHAIDPQLGGLILLGHRGCAKSTLARAFSQVLPPAFAGEEVPFVEIPLGATEDRLLGSIDASSLIEKGEWSARIGLIQQANQGILYIDEINLLPDHLSDSILDSAASGFHRIERDGISSRVEARYILIGSMNPEEGDLRPQLLDRFAHGVQVSDDFTVEERMSIVERRMAFDDDPVSFANSQKQEIAALRRQILNARACLLSIRIPDHLRLEIAQTAKSLQLEGVRAELGAMRTARCLAAWDGRDTVQTEDVEEAWILCLGHRQAEIQPPSPPMPPQPKEKQSSQSGAPRQSPLSTSLSPTEARMDNLKLDEVHPAGHEALKGWWQSGEHASSPQFYSNNGSHRIMQQDSPFARICWTNSFLASIREGWKPGKLNWQMRFRRSTRKANTWVFLDASRSTAAIHFLAEARNVLLSLKQLTRSSRFHILLLKDNQPSWLLKRGTAGQAERLLATLNDAGGKSYLAQTLQRLARSIQRQGVLESDRILICSDGLTSPRPGESAKNALQGFRSSLQQLIHFGIPVAWLHPTPKRGMSQWIPKLIHKLPIHPISLEHKRGF